MEPCDGSNSLRFSGRLAPPAGCAYRRVRGGGVVRRVAVYDPLYDPFYYGYRRFRPYPYYGSPWGPYRVVGGGYSYVLKALAFKYGGPPPAQ